MHDLIIDILRATLAPSIFFLFGFGVLPIFKSPAKNRAFLDKHGRFLIAAGVCMAVIASAVVITT